MNVPTISTTSVTTRVVRTPGVCGGDARIDGTRIPVWLLVNARRLGASDAEILFSYPQLTPADLAAAWEFADRHAEEMDELIQLNEAGEAGFVD